MFAVQAFEATDRLVDQPHLGRVVPELQIDAIREIPLYSYRIIYRVLSEEQIHVLTIHHGARLLHMGNLGSSSSSD